jgi:hypothetical protein
MSTEDNDVGSFGWVLRSLKGMRKKGCTGNKFQRAGWNGKGMWISICFPNDSFDKYPSDMTLPYLFMFTADKQTVPWLASQTDMLADDWSEVEP